MEEAIIEMWKHIAVINDELSSLEPIKIDVAILKVQMAQIGWIVKAIGISMIGMFVSQYFQFKAIKKNGGKNK